MNKTLKKSLLFVGGLFFLFGLARITNILQWYKSPSDANYPTIQPGNRIFASNMVKPERFSFVCYKWNDAQFGDHVRVHRLCGLEGDTVEIRDGDLLINGNFVDSSLPVAHYYMVSKNDIEKVRQFEKIDDENMLHLPSSDSFLLRLTDRTVKLHSIPSKRQLLAKSVPDASISAKFSANWNQDQFGPVVVPKDAYFLLGDNRNGSADSRYIGFIEKSRFVGTVIGK